MKQFIIMCALLMSMYKVQAQGCVAVRSGGAMCTMDHADTANQSGWQLNTGYRYFYSFRHYVGKEEQKERVERGTDVRNWQHAVDVTLIRHFNNRWSLYANLPVISNRRSSMYEHYGNNSTSPIARNETHSFGIGDLRVAVQHWIFNPETSKKGNVQIGAGLKLPTGDYRYTDFFHKPGAGGKDSVVLGPVDQSIQLGDGGTGFTVEANAYYNFSKTIGVYGNFFYLLNPREHNGVSTARGGATAATALAYGSSVMSVPDQYMLRGGVNASFGRLTVSAGARMECVPAKDLIGGSSGFRRPGYIMGVEPGINYQLRRMNLFATVPVWTVRNRTQSVPDKVRTQLTGVYAHGDAAFSDYTINIGWSVRF
ncbi:hypothetical protein PDL71_00765 [Lacibacter sp. MH-610]|uniref:hypothetical protein n=1 Tax=Lacibacter sp. MH-610 TaxID=3020883 RepID=UPI003891F432